MNATQAKRPYIALTLLMLIISAQVLYRWHGHPYNPDETWTVHLGVQTTAPQLLQRIALHDWAALPAPWMLLQRITRLVGHHEIAVRYMQWLLMLPALSLTYRLGRRLHSSNAGVLLVTLNGITPLFLEQPTQARSYGLYVLTAAALLVLFLRWLDKPTFWHALGYVMVGILGVYSHQYLIYVVIAQAAYLLIGVRWQWGRVLRGFGLFAMVGGAFVAVWGAVILHAIQTSRGGIGYGVGDVTANFLLTTATQYLTPSYLLVFALVGLFTLYPTPTPPQDSPHRWPRNLGAAYITLWAAVVLALALIVNRTVSVNITARNLIVFIVPLNALITLGLMALPARPRVGAVVVLATVHLVTYRIPAPISFRDTAATLAPYLQADTRVIMQTDGYWLHIETMYYLHERYGISPSQVGGLSRLTWDTGLLVMPPTVLYDYSEADQLAAFIDDAPRLLWITWESSGPSEDSRANLLADYRAAALPPLSPPHDTIRLYYRVPDVDAPQVRFQHADLMAWNAPDGLTAPACDSVPLHTWWRSPDDERPNMSLALTLIDANGGELARSDGRLTQAETALWDTNTLQLDERTLSIPCDVPAGSYALLAAVSADGEPLPTLDAGGAPNGPAYTYLTNITVTEATP